VAAEAEQVERTRIKDLVSGPIRGFCALQATEFDVGFPNDFIAETTPWVLGEAAQVERVTPIRPP